MKVLIADDEKGITVTLSDFLVQNGYEVEVVNDGVSVLEKVTAQYFDCLILDMRLPRLSGMDVLRKLKEMGQEIPVIVITGFGSVESAVECMKLGAYDYIQKPFLNEEVLIRLQRLERFDRLKKEYMELKEEERKRYGFGNIVGKSKPMQEVYRLIEIVSQNDVCVLIEGESGTGKELVAKAIHYNSPRKNQPFVKVSCNMVPETLIEDELFGHEKGAFTDAKAQKIGKFERADKGTLFIDDIDDMPPSTQAKFLNVLQDKTFERIGGESMIKVDVRFIVATKVSLEEQIKAGKFRDDLYHRINVVKIKLPPLRERTGDIPLLVEHFINLYSKGEKYEVSPDVLYALEEYNWPGNVRELEKAIERAIVLSGKDRVLRKEHILLAETHKPEKQFVVKLTGRKLKNILEACEVQYIKEVLRRTKNVKTEAAKILGISRKSLWQKLKQYGLES